MVNPDQIRAGEGEGISTPDVLVVQVTDLDVLNDDVLACKGESLSLDNAFVSNTQNGLVGTNFDGGFRSLVVGDSLLHLTRIASVQQNALALCSSSPGCACFV